MKKITGLLLFFGLILLLTVSSCRKNDSIEGGSLSKENVDMTTFDFIKSQPLLDSVALLIEKAGLKDAINAQGATVFIPTDYAILKYIADRQADSAKIDEKKLFTFEMLMSGPKGDVVLDSLRGYIFNEKITRDELTTNGVGKSKTYTSLLGMKLDISLEETDEYDDYTWERPKYIYMTRVFGIPDKDVKGDISVAESDMKFKMETTGIKTKTGILHVIRRSEHVAFFRK